MKKVIRISLLVIWILGMIAGLIYGFVPEVQQLVKDPVYREVVRLETKYPLIDIIHVMETDYGIEKLAIVYFIPLEQMDLETWEKASIDMVALAEKIRPEATILVIARTSADFIMEIELDCFEGVPEFGTDYAGCKVFPAYITIRLDPAKLQYIGRLRIVDFLTIGEE